MKKVRNWYGDVSPMTDEDWERFWQFLQCRFGTS
jgi:hypothetical protein